MRLIQRDVVYHVFEDSTGVYRRRGCETGRKGDRTALPREARCAEMRQQPIGHLLGEAYSRFSELRCHTCSYGGPVRTHQLVDRLGRNAVRASLFRDPGKDDFAVRRADEEHRKPIIIRLAVQDRGEHVEALCEDMRSERNRPVRPLVEGMLALEQRTHPSVKISTSLSGTRLQRGDTARKRHAASELSMSWVAT